MYYVNCMKRCQAQSSATLASEDRTMNKYYEEEDCCYRSECNDLKMDSVLFSRLPLFCFLTILGKLYCREAPFTESRHEDRDIYPLRIMHVYGQVVRQRQVESTMTIIY